MGKVTHFVYGIKWVKNAVSVKLPEAASKGMISSRDQMDGVLLTMAPAHTTAVAAQGINKGHFAGRRKTDSPELAGRKAGTTATAVLPRSLGNVLCPEKEAKTVAVAH